MKAIFLAAAFWGLAAFSNNFANAECGNDVTPGTRAALHESADALTKCSAFYHMLSVEAVRSQGPESLERFKRWSAAARESIIISAMMVNMAAVPDSDPTTRFNEYLQGLEALLAVGGGDWARGFSAQCKTELAQGQKAMMNYRDGR